MTTPLPKSALTKTEQKKRWAAAQAARNRARCQDEQHTWWEIDQFTMASGERVRTFQCRSCKVTTFSYSDRADP